jgi:cobalamin biosynthesis Co2+ chelatase CbiK
MIRMTKRFHAGMVIRSPRSSPELALDHDFVFLMCCEVVFADGDDGEYKISDVDTGFNKFTSLTLQTCMFKTKDHEERFINTLKREFQALNPDQYTEALVWYDEVLRSPGIALLK